MDKITVNRKKCVIDGCEEPCIVVSNGCVDIRISTMYHYIGRNTILIVEFIDGEYNGEEEIGGDFNTLTDREAVLIAKGFSCYL